MKKQPLLLITNLAVNGQGSAAFPAVYYQEYISMKESIKNKIERRLEFIIDELLIKTLKECLADDEQIAKILEYKSKRIREDKIAILGMVGSLEYEVTEAYKLLGI